MSQELLRIVDGLARDKNINREVVLEDLEAAMLSAIRKQNVTTEDITVHIDRQNGNISATVDGEAMSHAVVMNGSIQVSGRVAG